MADHDCHWPPVDDVEALVYLLKGWYGVRENMVLSMCHVLKLRNIADVFREGLSGTHRLCPELLEGPHDLWYRAENRVIDVFRCKNRGVIVFDVGPGGELLPPDAIRLRQYLVKALNVGGIDKKVYRPLMRDRVRFEQAAEQALKSVGFK